MKTRRWIFEHKVLVDFLLHIPWMIWRTFLNILDRIREDIEDSLVFRAVNPIRKGGLSNGVKRFLEFWAFEILKLARDAVKAFGVLALAALLIGIVVATDPKHAFSVEGKT